MDDLPNTLRIFINESNWVFAKTYAKTWPHKYVVRDEVNDNKFVEFVWHIRANGYLGKFYTKDITYFDDANMVYWTMGAPIGETTIINRCGKKQTYEYRLANNDLPNNEI